MGTPAHMNGFVKSHGLGNDYFVLDGSRISFGLTPAAIRLLCDRNYGIGSDGILLLVPSARADFGLRILNPDGSEAEKSGNGLRIFAKYLYEHGHTDKKEFKIDTPGGVVTAELEVRDGRVPFVTVEMGTATFDSRLIPVTGDEREVVNEEMRIEGEVLKFTAVSVGNPHCVVFTEKLDEGYTKLLGPLIETSCALPQPYERPVRKGRLERQGRDNDMGAGGRLHARFGEQLLRRGGGVRKERLYRQYRHRIHAGRRARHRNKGGLVYKNEGSGGRGRLRHAERRFD